MILKSILIAGASMENLSVQTFLDECRTLVTEVEQTGENWSCNQCFGEFSIWHFWLLAIDQEEDDIFQCGRCKSQFTSLHVFILHKREHLRVQEQSVDLNQYLINGDNQIVQVCSDNHQNDSEYNPEGDFDHSNSLAESIILEENDILFK